MANEYAFEFHPEICIQCHACEVACKTWRGVEGSIGWRKVIAVEQGKFPDTKMKVFSVSCQHCAHPACMDVCPAAAISKNAEGIVLVDRDLCIGCGMCQTACPFDIPQFGADGTMQKCDMCSGITPQEMQSPCVRMCPSQALKKVWKTSEEKTKAERALLAEMK